jgi:mannose-6-phosphate isomerase-like protein (cupin superfamily)
VDALAIDPGHGKKAAESAIKEPEMTKVREFMTGWESPDTHQMIPLVWSDRNKENLRGVAKGKRFTPKLRPFDMLSEPNQRLKIFESADVRVGVESVTGTQNFRRNSDFDEVLIQFCGTSHVESEFGKFDLAMGEVLVIPGGVSYRSTGANDCLRMVLNLHEPIFKVFNEAEHTSETTYSMRRTNGPNWSAPPAPQNNAKVIEKLYIWDEDPEDATIIERDYSDLVGVSSIKSKENIVKKIRAFDIFNEITGKGPGPKIIESPHCLIDTYNTVGDQWAFHRALRSEEFALQFQGTGDNMSEYEHKTPTKPGDVMLVPIGIGHCIENCSKDFRRMVIYSRQRLNVLVSPAMHLYDSKFETKETVHKPAKWHAEVAAM